MFAANVRRTRIDITANRLIDMMLPFDFSSAASFKPIAVNRPSCLTNATCLVERELPIWVVKILRLCAPGSILCLTTRLQIRRGRPPETSSDLHDIVHCLDQGRSGSP